TTGITGKKEGKALWKKGSAYLTTRLIPVVPVFPVVWPLLFQLKIGINLGPDLFRHQPWMNLDNQPSGFDRRIGLGPGFRFFGRFRVEDENSAQITVLHKRAGSEHLSFVHHSADVP